MKMWQKYDIHGFLRFRRCSENFFTFYVLKILLFLIKRFLPIKFVTVTCPYWYEIHVSIPPERFELGTADVTPINNFDFLQINFD